MPGNVRGQSQSTIPPFMMRPLEGIAQEAETLRNQGFPSYRPQDPAQARMGNFPADMRRAMELGRQTGQYIPALQEAQHQTGRSFETFPDRAQYYNIPYERNVLDRIKEEATKNFNEVTSPSIRDRFIKSGQHGSSRHHEIFNRHQQSMLKDIQNKQADFINQGYKQNYEMHNSDQVRRLAAARQMADLGMQGQAGKLSDIGALENQANYFRNWDQQRRDLAHQEYIRAQQAPWEALQMQSALMHGMPYQSVSGQHFFQGATQPTYQPSTMGDISRLLYGLHGMNKAGS